MKSWLPANVTPPQPPDAGAAYPVMPEDYPQPSQASPIRIQRLLIFLRKFWWIPVITLLLSVGAAVAYVYYMPVTYISTGTLWETEKLHLPDGAAFTGDLQNYYGTQMELLQNPRLHQLAIQRLETASTNGIPKDKDGQPIRAKITARQQPKSTIFVLTASSLNAEFSEAFLNALMNEYLVYKRSVRKTVSGDTLNSISEQILRLERDLDADRAEFNAFQRTNNLSMLQEEGTISGGYLARLKTQLSDLELEQKILSATAPSPSGDIDTNTVPDASSIAAAPSDQSREFSSERSSAHRELELLRIQRDKLSKYLRPKHPKIVRLDDQIQRAQRILELYQTQSAAQLAAAQRSLGMKIDTVKSSIKDWEDKVVIARARIAEAERLKLNVSRSQSIYDRLVQMMQNVNISRSIDQDTLAILQPAGPAVASNQQRYSIVLGGAFLGFAFGLGLIFLIQVLDDRFTSATEVIDKFGDSIVGQVPEVKHLKNDALVLKNGDEPHIFSESYRNLRSALLFFTAEDQRPRVILVTSAVPNEGKSTVAANLAKSFALGGARVLLVDGDLRKGHLHKILGMENTVGLSDLLISKEPSDGNALVQRNGIPGFHFISRGASPRHPGDLFLKTSFDQLLTQWRLSYDFVIIDSSPVFAADDATTLAPKVDATLFVVRRGYSRSRAVREALELLTRRQARILGIVFNRADASARSYNYYKHPEYQPAGEGLKAET